MYITSMGMCCNISEVHITALMYLVPALLFLWLNIFFLWLLFYPTDNTDEKFIIYVTIVYIVLSLGIYLFFLYLCLFLAYLMSITHMIGTQVNHLACYIFHIFTDICGAIFGLSVFFSLTIVAALISIQIFYLIKYYFEKIITKFKRSRTNIKNKSTEKK